MQTGLYSHTHGVHTNLIPLDTDGPTIAKLFNEAGYKTGYAGKWHLSSSGRIIDTADRSIPRRNRAGWTFWRGYECAEDHYSTYIFNRGNVVEKGPRMWEPEWLTNTFTNFLTQTHGRPWAFYLAPSSPHLPMQCPQRFLKLYEADSIYPPIFGMIPTEFLPKYQVMMRMYYGQISAIDYQIGRILKMLRESDELENTIIVYTSDHGDTLGHHCYNNFENVLPGTSIRRMRGKREPYRSAFHIPLLIQWPLGIRSGQTCNALTDSVDLAPTILDLAGIDIPDSMQGQSMAGWCRGDSGPNKDAIYLECDNEWRAIWDGRFIYSPYGRQIMYDHHRDSHELNNVYADSAYGDDRVKLASDLLRLAAQTSDPLLGSMRSKLLAPNLSDRSEDPA
jgi:arylsulfatase A-like enzyme